MVSTTDNSEDGIQQENRPLLQPSTSKISSSNITNPAVQTARSSNLFRQVFLGIIIALPSLPCGMSLGFSAVSFEQLRLTLDQESWFASVTIMSFPIGCLLVGPLMDKFGRRPALMLINIINIMGWVMLAVPAARPTIVKLILGRMLTGVAGGLASVPGSVYAVECLCPNSLKMRSSLVAWSTVSLCAGICLVYVAGAAVDFFTLASIAALIAILALILVAIFIPESPVWLTMKGRYGDAEWSMKVLNIVQQDSSNQYMSSSNAEEGLGGDSGRRTGRSEFAQVPQPETLRELMKPESYKPLLIIICFFFFQQFSGVFIIIAYVVDIIRAAGVIMFNAYTLTVIAGCLIFSLSILASILYPTTGIRAIAVISGLGTTTSMLFIGSFLTLRHYWILNPEWYFLNWFPVIAILTNIASSTIGFLILPWSMLGEIFPLSVKGIAAGIATSVGLLFGFIAIKLYPYMLLGFGTNGVFFFFGVMALLGTIFVILFLPETRGKTLQDILDGFSKKRNRRS